MSVETEVTSMIQNIKDDYEGIENLGVDLTNIDKNIQNIRTCLDTIYTNLPKVTGDGTEVTLTPTLKGKLNIQEKGNSTQEGEPTPSTPIPIKSVTGDNNVVVEGKNKFSGNVTRAQNCTYENGVIIMPKNTDTVPQLITFSTSNLPKGKTYTVSFDMISEGASASLIFDGQPDNATSSGHFIDTGFTVATTSQRQTITGILNADVTDFRFFRINSMGGFDTASITISNIQIEEGSTATTYEPYYTPQTLPLNLGSIELNKIGDYQDYIYKTSGKNLFTGLTKGQRVAPTTRSY